MMKLLRPLRSSPRAKLKAVFILILAVITPLTATSVGMTNADKLICLAVAFDAQPPEFEVIHTDCQSLVLNNAGQLGKDMAGNESGHNMNFYDDCDTTNNVPGADDNAATYLREASPFILRVTPTNDTVLYSYMFDADWTTSDGFRPLDVLTVDSTTDPSVMVAKTGRYMTPDSLIMLESEMYAPQDPDSCEFWVQKLYVHQNRNLNPSGTLPNLFIGELMDWDIPSDSGVEDGSDFDISRQMMYCYGGEYGADAVPNNDCELADSRMGGMAFYGGYRVPHIHPDAFNVDSLPIALGAWTGTNANWIDPTGNWDPQALYNKMSTFSAYEAWAAQNPGMEDSLYQNLNMVSMFGNFDLGANDTLVFVKIFATTRDGLSDLQSSVDKAKIWIQDHGIFEWPPLIDVDCCGTWAMPGDLTGDGSYNMLDLLAFIAYLFNTPPGPGSDCLEVLDVDGSGEPGAPLIDILDLSYLVKFMLLNGPAPVCPGAKSAGQGEEVSR